MRRGEGLLVATGNSKDCNLVSEKSGSGDKPAGCESCWALSVMT